MSATERPGSPVPPALTASVFCVAAAVIAFEIALTRCFSVLLRYHYVFLIVSIATFGLGAGGLLDYALLRRRSGPAWGRLAWLAAALAPLPALSVLALFRPPVSHYLTSLWLVAGVSMPAFLMAGLFLSCVWRSFPEHGGRLYAADLTGAAIGSVAVIAGLQFFGGTGAPMAAGVLLGVGAVGLAWHAGGLARKACAAAATVACAGLLAANLITGFADLPSVPTTTDRAVKTLYQELGDPKQGARIVYTDWNAFARTDVVQYRPPGEPKPWDDLYVYTDGDVPTNMKPFDGDLRKVLPDLESFIGFLPFRLQRPERVLLIGPGGGLDILLAMAVGARQIDGAELNPSIPRIMRRYADLNGHLYEYANVDVRVEEGRSCLRRSRGQYDMVYMALTYAATTSGSASLALVESYLHTVEALRGCLQRLTPDGQLVFVCGERQLLLRAFLTALEALQQEGVPREEALRCLAVVDVPPPMYPYGAYRHMLMVRRRPFTDAQSRELARTAMAMRLIPGYCPRVYEPMPFAALLEGAPPTKFDDYLNAMAPGSVGLTAQPVTDDRPFFADLTVALPPGFGRFLAWSAGALVALMAAACVVPRLGGGHLAAGTGAPDAESETGTAGRIRQVPSTSLGLLPIAWVPARLAFFAGIGIGFMLIEVCLAQKLILYLGYPTLSLATVLFALLLGGGLGSRLSQTWPVSHLASWAALSAGAAALLTLAALGGLDRLFDATLAWPVLARTFAAVGVSLPLGVAMGTQFPSGVRRLGEANSALLPWCWATNGLASVLGSVGAMCGAKLWGFSTILGLGAGCYLFVSLLSGLEALLGSTGTPRREPFAT